MVQLLDVKQTPRGKFSTFDHTLGKWGLPLRSEYPISSTMLNITKTPSAAFRDIRPDLRERLRSSTAELGQMRGIIENLEKAVEVLEQMLAEEERRFNPADTTKKSTPTKPLADFVMHSLRTGMRSKDDLRWMAVQAGYDVDGRSIHATLVNLMKRNEAAEISDGQFAAKT